MNALSIDVEDYFQVEAFATTISYDQWDKYPSRIEQNTRKILDILDRHKVKATFFCLGWITERYPNLIREISEKGHEIASHGYAHQPIYRQSPETFREDVKKVKQVLEDLTGKPVFGYRAPTYSITQKTLWALEILAEEGYKYDSSIFPIKHDLYGMPNASRFPFKVKTKLTEFPITTLRIFHTNIPIAGGGYFRLLPYIFIKKALRHVNKEGQAFIFYIHPWEFDPDQPRINQAPWRSRFRHYLNLNKTEKRFEKLLSDFRFSPVLEVLRQKSLVHAK